MLLWELVEETLDTTVPGGSTLVSVTIEVMVTPLLVETAVDSQVDVEETDNTLVVSCAEDDVEVGGELEVKAGPGAAVVGEDDVGVEVGEEDEEEEEEEEDEKLEELDELEELLLLDEEELFKDGLGVTIVEEVDESVENWPWEDNEGEPEDVFEDGVVVSSLPRLDMIVGNKEKKGWRRLWRL